MIPEKKGEQKYSYADYLTWSGDERIELINGEAWDMSYGRIGEQHACMRPAPAPNMMHQKISMLLTLELGSFLKGKPCDLFVSPFDVRYVKDKKQMRRVALVVLI